jgi:hypothetical protein
MATAGVVVDALGGRAAWALAAGVAIAAAGVAAALSREPRTREEVSGVPVFDE